MAHAILINDRGSERDYQITGNTLITLKLEDDLSEITFYDSNGNKLDGEFEFKDEYDEGVNYLLRRMYAPKNYKKSGLGRAAIEFFKDCTRASLYARENDGQVRDDGSHLTENAPAFVAKMIKEGLLTDNTYYPDDDY